MKSWKLFPKIEAIAKYVECYWFLEKESFNEGFDFPKLNPDPCSHLIISGLDRSFEYMYAANSQTVSGSHWIFPHVNTFTMDHSDLFRIIGIKFRTGALYSLNLKKSIVDLDKIEAVDIKHLVGSKTFSGDFLLTNAAEQEKQVCNILDNVLLPWLLESQEDKHSDLVRHILLLLSETTVTDIGDKLHRSQRTIERSFKRVAGLSMKQVKAMIHLEEMLNYLYQLKEGDIDWADVANKYGFSDQPHLIRHLKKSIGKTPASYAKQRDLAIDIYGNFEFN